MKAAWRRLAISHTARGRDFRQSAAVILSRSADTRVALMLLRRGHYDVPRLLHGNQR